jgi:hypothetical protein
MVWWGFGREYLVVDQQQRRIWIRYPLTDLTQAWVLHQIADELPQWGKFVLWDLETVHHGRHLIREGSSHEVTLGEFNGALHEVHRQETSYGEDEPRAYQYLTYQDPEEVRWYHATLARHLPSIMQHGLLPSRVGEGGGWSPGWNLGLQNAVYLCEDIARTYQIAETLVENTNEDAVIIEVEGAGLRGQSLTLDEDAIISPDDGGVNPSMIDTDFPDFATSRDQAVRSLGVRGRIDPRYLLEVLHLHVELSYFDRYQEPIPDAEGAKFVEKELTLSGPAAVLFEEEARDDGTSA